MWELWSRLHTNLVWWDCWRIIRQACEIAEIRWFSWCRWATIYVWEQPVFFLKKPSHSWKLKNPNPKLLFSVCLLRLSLNTNACSVKGTQMFVLLKLPREADFIHWHSHACCPSIWDSKLLFYCVGGAATLRYPFIWDWVAQHWWCCMGLHQGAALHLSHGLVGGWVFHHGGCDSVELPKQFFCSQQQNGPKPKSQTIAIFFFFYY